ncbi:MAG: riboflavin synthase [Alphaproteobacteria bacterium]|nr:riboflavin synthase [Alphaproteobacteria bacterium]
MFTGLVQDIGVVKSIDHSRGDLRIEIESQMNLDVIQLGASVCCSGCCLTVVQKESKSLFFDVSKESLDKTIISSWVVGSRVNLEPSLKVGDEMGGHFVSGHVDVTTKIAEMRQEGDSWRITFGLLDDIRLFIASKGSVTIDGISLTVNEVNKESFGVNIIDHTWKHTTLSDRKIGDFVNIEIDMLARYVANMLQQRELK